MFERREYPLVRERIRAGDIIAFGGNSPFSRWTKFTTGSVVTHVAIIIQSQQTPTEPQRFFNLLMEATVYDGRQGVMTNRLGDRIERYEGDIWWLPLNPQARSQFEENQSRFLDFMLKQQHKGYDVLQLFGAAVDVFDAHPILAGLSYNEEDFNRWFCSELIAQGLKVAGVVEGLNASEVTPDDICRFNIFDNRYVQLKGEETPIAGFNSQSPTNWGYIA